MKHTIQKAMQRAKDKSLWNTTTYVGFVWYVRSNLGRLRTIHWRGEPVFNNSTKTIVIKFVKQNVIIDSIKSFLEVYEDSIREKALIHIRLYCVYEV